MVLHLLLENSVPKRFDGALPIVGGLSPLSMLTVLHPLLENLVPEHVDSAPSIVGELGPQVC